MIAKIWFACRFRKKAKLFSSLPAADGDENRRLAQILLVCLLFFVYLISSTGTNVLP
jgi:hypothetical protein